MSDEQMIEAAQIALSQLSAEELNIQESNSTEKELEGGKEHE